MSSKIQNYLPALSQPKENYVEGGLKGEELITEDTKIVISSPESLKLKIEQMDTAFDIKQSSCKTEIEQSYDKAPDSEANVKETTGEGVGRFCVKEEELVVKEDKREFPAERNSNESVESSKIDGIIEFLAQ